MSPQTSPNRGDAPGRSSGSAAGRESLEAPRPGSTLTRTVLALLDVESLTGGSSEPAAVALRYACRGLITTLRQHPALAERWEYEAEAMRAVLEGGPGVRCGCPACAP